MHILADENIAQATECFSPYGRLSLMPGREITAQVMADVDVLLVRSVTRINAQLLDNSPCRYVATATSGIDHIDVEYLASHGIGLGWAKGCNADAVVDYVFSSLAVLWTTCQFDWTKTTVGIAGCGEIGSRLATRLLKLGITPVIYDPFLDSRHPLANWFGDLDAVLGCQVLTLHTPLTKTGAWPTFHLIGEEQLARLRPDAVLINACRGAVVSNAALLRSVEEYPARKLVLDAWEGEPGLDLTLFKAVTLGTAHIAGYSLEGKLNGTVQVHEQFCEHFGVAPEAARINKPVGTEELEIQETGSLVTDLSTLILKAYNVALDSDAMQTRVMEALSGTTEAGIKEAGIKEAGIKEAQAVSAVFDMLRKEYPMRHEFSHYRVGDKALGPGLRAAIRALGFR